MGDHERGVEAVRALARAARLLERASSEISMGHYRVLSAIAEGEDRAARVAERLALGRPTVSAAVDALCRGGLLDRAEVDGDQRGSALGLTPAGSALLERVEGEMVRLLADLCDRTPAGSQTEEALASLGAAIDGLLAERRDRHQGGRR
jgi:DNA-binding MarR family transcriptional regulator